MRGLPDFPGSGGMPPARMAGDIFGGGTQGAPANFAPVLLLQEDHLVVSEQPHALVADGLQLLLGLLGVLVLLGVEVEGAGRHHGPRSGLFGGENHKQLSMNKTYRLKQIFTYCSQCIQYYNPGLTITNKFNHRQFPNASHPRYNPTNHVIKINMKADPTTSLSRLSQLSLCVRRWNVMGHSLLPQLQLVVIAGQKYHQHLQKIMGSFGCQEIEVRSQEEAITGLYRLFMMGEGFCGRVHVVQGISDAEIKDEEFKQRKKYMEKFRRKRDVIFVVFSAQDCRQLEKKQEHITEFGLGKSIDKVIHYQLGQAQSRFLLEVLNNYENSFRFELVTNYQLMRQERKNLQKQISRYLQWKQVLNGQVNPISYSLMSFKLYADTMISSFSGTYSSCYHYQKLGIVKSINWKTLQLLHAFWEVQSDILFKQVDSFPLSYIEQQYKMSDHYSIGGFLPESCFKAIFSPPLYSFRDALMAAVDNIKQSVIRHVELALRYSFEHSSIGEGMLERELEKVEAICDKFVREMQMSLESQIEFIHANPEEFWNYRQLNTSIYSPEQQIYIEIKYIGKAYVRKVYESIKDSVPRFIGQGLLKKLVRYFAQESINTFMEVTKVSQYRIVLSENEISTWEQKLNKLKQLNNLISFFSLKVSASYFIKNFHDKKQKEWDRMFGRSEKPPAPPVDEELVSRGGLLNWMRNVFKFGDRGQRTRRRANSESKNEGRQVQKEDQTMQANNKSREEARSPIINEKNWLLIINTGREVSHQRIRLSASQGFPTRFRSSIWMYLSTNKKPKAPKLKTLLLQTPDPKTVLQIEKDIPRTSPQQLFKYSLKTSIKNVLVGYSLHDKETGYTQGMNSIVAVILQTLVNYGEKASSLVQNKINYDQVEEKAFCILKHVMEDCGVKKVMRVEAELLADLSVRLNDRIKQLSPKMFELIAQTPFNIEMIFSSPLISCLTNVTKNLNLMKRFMDLLIVHDFFIVYKMIAQFVAHAELVQHKINADNVYNFMKNRMYDEIYDVVGETGLNKMFANL